jgi:ParB family transcriptional regulator, chromosome partitioning protein
MNNKQPAQRRGLGRGLGSLIPTAPPEEPGARAEETGFANGVPAQGRHSAPTTESNGGGVATLTEERPVETVEAGPSEAVGAYFAELPVGAITPNPRQPRQVFDEEAMAELVHSVEEVGLLQPIVVRRTGESSYELIMGARRWRATQQAGLDTIPAIVRQTDDEAMLRDALLENLHRSQLNPLEEAAAYRQLLDDFGCTHDELAGRIGRSRPQISNTLRLLNLSPSVQRRVAAGVISAGHARALLGVTEPLAQDRLAGRVVSEGISVRGLEELVAVGEHGDDEDKPAVRHPRPSAPGLNELNDRLSDRLDTRVKVTLGRNKGKIAIEFASLTDLERIVSIIDPRNREDRPI